MSHRVHIFLIILIAIMIFLSADIFSSYTFLHVTNWEYDSDKIQSPIRICVIADLHNHSFGKDNKRLVQTIQKQSPDIILMAGDMLNEDSPDDSIPVTLIQQLKSTTPIYYAMGNHEQVYMKKHPELIEDIRNAGAYYVEGNYIDTIINHNAVRIGGWYEYAFGHHMPEDTLTAESADEKTKSFLKDFCNTDSYKIMLSHRPDSFVFSDASKVYDIDLVISGHDHGGQVILPFLGGLYGGDLGFFSKYLHGMHEKDKMHLFITSGLSSSKEKLPRFNNLPEVAMITIQ